MLLKESLLHELCHVFNYMVLYLWAPYTYYYFPQFVYNYLWWNAIQGQYVKPKNT